MDVSIVIVSYNVPQLLAACLESLQKQTTPYSSEIWVVDNASTDNSAQWVQSQFPSIHWIQNDQNVGFATANNQAIRRANGRYIWLLNPDTIVGENALTALVDCMEQDATLGACGSRLINPDASLQPSCYPFPTLGREIWRLFHLDTIYKLAEYPMDKWGDLTNREVDNIQGASLLLRKTALDQVGLLDESFFMYTEEVDLNYRLKRAGWKNLWVPASKVIHYGGQSTQQNRTPMFLQLYQTKVQFFRKHYGAFITRLYKGVLFFSAMLRVLGSFLMKLKTSSNAQTHQHLFTNYFQLLKNVASF